MDVNDQRPRAIGRGPDARSAGSSRSIITNDFFISHFSLSRMKSMDPCSKSLDIKFSRCQIIRFLNFYVTALDDDVTLSSTNGQ